MRKNHIYQRSKSEFRLDTKRKAVTHSSSQISSRRKKIRKRIRQGMMR